MVHTFYNFDKRQPVEPLGPMLKVCEICQVHFPMMRGGKRAARTCSHLCQSTMYMRRIRAQMRKGKHDRP